MPTIAGEQFDVYTSKIDATSGHRPDPHWLFVDLAGHTHEWHHAGNSATAYDPRWRYELPTLEWVEDEPEYIDGDEVSRGHHECRLCRERVRPGYTADTHRTYVPGLTRYVVNGEMVTPEEFESRARAALKRAGVGPDEGVILDIRPI